MFLSSLTNYDKPSEESFLRQQGDNVDASKSSSSKTDQRSELDIQINLHLTQHIFLFRSNNSTRLRGESLIATKKWMHFAQFSQALGNSPFTQLNSSEIDDFFLKNGICVGGVIQHFSRFFKARAPQDCPPFSVRDPMELDLDDENGKIDIKFYPFRLERECLERQTREPRLIQSAYKAHCAYQTVESLEFLPPEILGHHCLKIQKRIPDLSVSQEIDLKITELLPTLRKLALQEQTDTGYLLGIKGQSIRHAIALHLKKPFHFMDLPYGVAVAGNLEQLTLFLAVYLTDKYRTCYSFSLLEFLSVSK